MLAKVPLLVSGGVGGAPLNLGAFHPPFCLSTIYPSQPRARPWLPFLKPAPPPPNPKSLVDIMSTAYRAMGATGRHNKRSGTHCPHMQWTGASLYPLLVPNPGSSHHTAVIDSL